MIWGAICTPRSFSLLLVFRHGVWEKVCEQLASHSKRNLSLLKPFCPPPVGGKHPLWELKVPSRLALGKNFRSCSSQTASSSSSLLYDVGNTFMQEPQVSTEGTKGSSGTSGCQMAKVQLPSTGTGCAQRRHSWLLYCIAKQYKGMITIKLSTEDLSFIKQKYQTFTVYSFSKGFQYVTLNRQNMWWREHVYFFTVFCNL